MTIAPDQLFQFGGEPVGSMLGIGNVYYVIQTTHPQYSVFIRDRQGTYKNDDSAIVHTSIASALTATVTKRNDYVIVMPDTTDYDEDETLTMNKNNVHLICPAGLGAPVGCMRGATIDPNSSAHAITITARGVEVAGFWIRGQAEYYCISISGVYGGGWGYIHHNDCAITSTSSSGTAAGGIIVSSTDAGAGTSQTIAYNRVFTMAGTTATVVGGITASYTSAWLQVIGNHVVVGNGCAMTFGIQNRGVMGIIADNYVYEAATSAGMSAGTLTVGIDVGESVFCVNNSLSIATTANAIETVGVDACVENYAGAPAGSIQVYTGSTT